jgi:hypothetical protein
MRIRVSELLAMAGCVDPWWFTAAGRQRGTTVHFIGEQLLLRRDGAFAPEYAGYAMAISNGMAALGFQPLVVERRLVHRTRPVKGRPDTCGLVPVRKGKVPAGPALVDIKSGNPARFHALQLGLYEILADDNEALQDMLPDRWRGYPWTRIGLYVHEDGKHQLKVYDDPGDRAVCGAILDLTEWRIANGIITSGRHGSGDGGGQDEPDDDPFQDAGPDVPAAGK